MHLHYSPYQWATGVQVADDDVNVKKILKVGKKLTAADAKKAKLIPTTMSCYDAHMITGSPTAFISPNSVDAMRTIHSVFGAT
jgi:hypothetical protein